MSPFVDRSNAIIHFYRAAASHSDAWRHRLDTTTNWAIVTNAGLITVGFGSASTEHFLLLLLLVLDGFFLLMESRRYQIYDIWAYRLRVLHEHVFAPVFEQSEAERAERTAEAMRELGEHLGSTRPRLRLADAIGFRIKRNYAMIFTVSLLAWMLKLWVHPTEPLSSAEFAARAHVGVVPGSVVMAMVGSVLALLAILALRAPSDRLVGWKQEPSLFVRAAAKRSLRHRRATTEELERRDAGRGPL